MKTNNELKNKMLSKEQASTVKEMIVNSMRGVYTDMGARTGVYFEKNSGLIADKIVKNTQMALMQNNVFAKAVKHSKPLKTKKK